MDSANYQQEIGDNVSQIFYDACLSTMGAGMQVAKTHGDNFRSPRTITLGDLLVGMHTDGVGTKIEVAELVGDYRKLGWDLVAMVCDDITAMGATPKMLTTTLDVGGYAHLFEWENIEALAEGLAFAARAAGVPVVGGEFAQLGSRVQGPGDPPMIWNATATWTAKEILTGDDVTAGHSIIALEEPGCRSNGFTLLRETLERHLGAEWYTVEWYDRTFGDRALAPSSIYTTHVQYLTHTASPKFVITGMIHVTGGGLAGRLRSYLNPRGLGAHINDPYIPGELFRYIIDKGWVSMRTAYETWCMGNGFLIITPTPDDVMRELSSRGIASKVIGTVTDQQKVEIIPPISLEFGE